MPKAAKKRPPLTEEQRAVVEKYIPMAMGYVSRKYAMLKARGITADDAKQWAVVVMCKAIQTYKPARGAITTHLMSALKFQFRGPVEDAMIRIPRNLFNAMEEKPGAYLVSQLPACDKDDYYIRVAGFSSDIEPLDQLCIDEEFDQLRSMLSCLPKRTRAIVEYTYGIDRPQKTLREMSIIFGVSRSRITELRLAAIRKLRRIARRETVA